MKVRIPGLADMTERLPGTKSTRVEHARKRLPVSKCITLEQFIEQFDLGVESVQAKKIVLLIGNLKVVYPLKDGILQVYVEIKHLGNGLHEVIFKVDDKHRKFHTALTNTHKDHKCLLLVNCGKKGYTRIQRYEPISIWTEIEAETN